MVRLSEALEYSLSTSPLSARVAMLAHRSSVNDARVRREATALAHGGWEVEILELASVDEDVDVGEGHRGRERCPAQATDGRDERGKEGRPVGDRWRMRAQPTGRSHGHAAHVATLLPGFLGRATDWCAAGLRLPRAGERGSVPQ